MVAKLFLLQFYLFGCVIVRLRKMLFAVAGLRPQNILLVFLASLENLKFRYEIVLQPSQCKNMILSWQKTEELLKKYQIPLVESLLIENAEQAVVFAGKVGYPVVLKLISSDVLHKVDKGLVKLNLQNEQQLGAAWKELRSFLPGRSEAPSSSFQVVIQKQAAGVELFMGIKRDKSFGPVISFGLGGIFVEVLNDIVLGLCPLDKNQAREMIKKIKGYKILQGYRGQPKIDIEKLADVLAGVSRLAMENESIKEIDFNPLFADGNNIIVADAKII